MNLALRTNLVRAALLASGAAAGAGGSIAVSSSGARESITLTVGDTVTPRFSIRTDTVLAVVGGSIVARKCGTSSIFLRVWRGKEQLSADTVTTTVIGCAPAPAVAYVDTTLSVCFRPNLDSLAKYHVSADTVVLPELIPCLLPEGVPDPIQPMQPRYPVAYKRLTPHYLVP